MPLQWEDAGNDGHEDQNASTRLVDHGYWQIGDDHGSWTVELIVQDAALDVIDQRHGAKYATEDDAKAHAERCERAR